MGTAAAPQFTPASPALREREERLTAMKTLAGQLAHDFKNFLTPVHGYAALIKEEAPDDSPIGSYATTLENVARRTGALVERIAGATRLLKSPRRDLMDLASVVEDELRAWEEQVRQAEAITVRSELEPCVVRGDEAQWRVAMRELLDNAKRAMAAGGKLEVLLAAMELDTERAAELGMASGPAARLVFRDNGTGMAPEAKRRAFEPFFTTQPKARGSGLGLSLVHTVVRSHGGQVELESEIGGGTCVTIWVPQVGPCAERDPGATASCASRP